eukprot:TRINITY_DN104_c0_g2_i3.p2 TRINITY_DN104_c0_g2~~TRINITY_DN104_c0_g2_i3.p2  ORF type:complete len:204 (-),score=21.12 TRINITY_DN104_c0_g2_i3:168-779(-)
MSDSGDQGDKTAELQEQEDNGDNGEEENPVLSAINQSDDVNPEVFAGAPEILLAVHECANNVTAEMSKGFEQNKIKIDLAKSFKYLEHKLIGPIQQNSKDIAALASKLDRILEVVNRVVTFQSSISTKITKLSSDVSTIQSEISSMASVKSSKKDHTPVKKSKHKVTQKSKVPKFNPSIPKKKPLPPPAEDCPYGHIPASLFD